jgi:hypothetical protein
MKHVTYTRLQISTTTLRHRREREREKKTNTSQMIQMIFNRQQLDKIANPKSQIKRCKNVVKTLQTNDRQMIGNCGQNETVQYRYHTKYK